MRSAIPALKNTGSVEAKRRNLKGLCFDAWQTTAQKRILGAQIRHFNVTEHPTGPWIVQQLREAFPETCPYRYAILDRDGKFGETIIDFLKGAGTKPTPISPASPWQNGVAERWIGSCRRELLDHVIVFNEVPLRGLLRDYISYYHADRIHDFLEKDTPAMRPVSPKPGQSARLVSFPCIGGLHHRYDWQKAA